MSILDQLLVAVGIQADELTAGAAGAADQVEQSLASVSGAADQVATAVGQAGDAAELAIREIGGAADQAAAATAAAAGRAATEIGDVGTAADRAAADVRQAAGQAETALEGIGDGATAAAAETDQAAGQMEQSLGGMQAAAAGAAVGALFMTGLTTAMDAKHANAKLTTQLNLSQEEAKRAGDIAGKVYSEGFSDSIDGVNDALGSVASAMGGMGKIGDAELAQLTKSAVVLGDAFEMDVGETATAAGALIKQGLVKDGVEAFDVITKAAQTLPKSMVADIPAVITEYGTHFKRIGLDAQDAFGMMSQYVQAGGRDIDQAADVLHEFARITSEETDRAAEGFKALGLPAKQMLADINRGGEPAKAALQKTIDALRGVKDPAKQAQLGVALFGDMAGESAKALWAMDPATAAAKSGMDQAAGSAKAATDAMAQSASIESAWRTLAVTLGEALAPALTAVASVLAEHPEVVKILIPAVLALGIGIGLAVVAQWAWNAALWAWPGTWIIAGIIALIAVIALIIANWDAVSAATSAAWDGITGALSAAWGWIEDAASATWDGITSGVSSAWNWVRDVSVSVWNAVAGAVSTAWGAITGHVEMGVHGVMIAISALAAVPGHVASWLGSIVGWVAALPGRIWAASRGMWDGLRYSFVDAINWLIWKWNSLSFTIGGGNFMGMDIPSFTLHTPDIPYLAEGGVVTGPTLAMVGEGREDEAVLPLSRLDGMLRSVAAPVRETGGGQLEVRTVLEVAGAESEFTDFFRAVVRNRAGGSVVRLAEG
ncbi:phage tail tape measure protein [Streptomyces sp. NPDC006798]|uniref:phage tail tape measure protein n=1 Tax=Streptomyces sp. NPDC006798 TaxID=3155462 RepID=UPI0033D39D70